MTIPEIDKDFLRKQLPDFARQTADYHNEKIGKIAYKEFSGYFGSFAQRDGKSNMLRLRCSAGRITAEKLAFIAEMIRKYNISRIHFTTGQTIQLHDLSAEAASEILQQCLDADIIPFGCGGDYPGNVLCSPLSGVEREELPKQQRNILSLPFPTASCHANLKPAFPIPRKILRTLPCAI